MDLADKVVIVTGAGSGIGRALARRIAREEPAGIVIADLDGGAAAAAAAEAGPRVIGVRCDVTDSAALQALIATARERFGPVDCFFANAGVAIGTDEQTPEEVWDRAFAVNVRSHIVAARILVPGWLSRSSGCLVVTASAAGLLTQIGVAPYAVTKHAAVAFAEWLSLTYGDRGIQVSCVCPMGVDTPMLEPAAQAGEGLDWAGAASVRSAGDVLTPDAVAQTVVEGVQAGRFLILPHPIVSEYFRRKATDYDRWLVGMRRLRDAVQPV